MSEATAAASSWRVTTVSGELCSGDPSVASAAASLVVRAGDAAGSAMGAGAGEAGGSGGGAGSCDGASLLAAACCFFLPDRSIMLGGQTSLANPLYDATAKSRL